MLVVTYYISWMPKGVGWGGLIEDLGGTMILLVMTQRPLH